MEIINMYVDYVTQTPLHFAVWLASVIAFAFILREFYIVIREIGK